MVTIEQKLTLFSKLLNQDIKEENDKKFNELEKEYEKIIAENKVKTDLECNEIIELAKRKAETKKVELISKGKLSSKKENMLTIEKLVERFMHGLEQRVNDFVVSSGYHAYLQKIISRLNTLNGYSNALVIYLTQNDYEQNQDFIKAELIKLDISPSKLSFEASTEPILGGLVIKDPVLNMRIDESIRASMEEAKNNIVEKITLAIGEAGEQNE